MTLEERSHLASPGHDLALGHNPMVAGTLVPDVRVQHRWLEDLSIETRGQLEW